MGVGHEAQNGRLVFYQALMEVVGIGIGKSVALVFRSRRDGRQVLGAMGKDDAVLIAQGSTTVCIQGFGRAVVRKI